MPLIERLTIRFLVYVFVTTVLVVVFLAYRGVRHEQPTPRNAWQQIPQTTETLCKSTILRWTKACGDTWVDRQQERDDG